MRITKRELLVYVEEIKDLKGVDEILVEIDRVEYYNLLRENKFSVAVATEKVTSLNVRKRIHSALDHAGNRRREIFSGLEKSWNDSRKKIHSMYMEDIRRDLRSYSLNKLPK